MFKTKKSEFFSNANVSNSVLTINGKSVSFSGKSVMISNGKVFIDGKPLDDIDLSEGDFGEVNITIEGNIGNLDCSGSVTVNGDCGSVTCNGKCVVNGDVTDNISVNGTFTN